ncbi:uncharacterized protein LOC142340297 [Convolutriloba macropyga]|uniref:uncharacterized protein LOC142340297 n=1 Tax=Convolutriloba macropyga TaxID=536237 RepID=UPI003F524F16
MLAGILLFISAIFVAVEASLPSDLWVPSAQMYTETSQLCKDIDAGVYTNYNTTANPENFQYSTIPESSEPGQKEGLNENNWFAKYLLCNLNKKRSEGNINRVFWHYGLAYQAETVNPCEENFEDNYSKYGFNIERLQASVTSQNSQIINGVNYMFHGAGWDFIDEWYQGLMAYKYPIDSSGNPKPFHLCGSRNPSYDYATFVAMMWSSATRVGCAPVYCGGYDIKMNCLFGSVGNVSPRIFQTNFPNHNGEAFSTSAQNLIDIAKSGPPFGGLPTCTV